MKALSPVIALILLLIIVVSLSTIIMSFMFSINQKTGVTAKQEIVKTTDRLENCLRVDHIDQNIVYVRNCGTKDFSGKIRVYVNNTGACISTDPQNHGVEINLSVPEGGISSFQIDCCIPEGTTSLKITSDTYYPINSKINDYQFPQNVFFEWEETEIFNLQDCLVNKGVCTSECNNQYIPPVCYKNCALDEEAINEIGDIVDENTILRQWTTAYPPYEYYWDMGNCDRTGQYFPDCGYCFTKMLKTKFYYNPAAFEGKEIWFVDGATQHECTLEGKNGIIINSNIYIFVNNELIDASGASYGDHTIDAFEDGPWCTFAVELTNPQFAEECAFNNITVVVEDWRLHGGVESFNLQTG